MKRPPWPCLKWWGALGGASSACSLAVRAQQNAKDTAPAAVQDAQRLNTASTHAAGWLVRLGEERSAVAGEGGDRRGHDLTSCSIIENTLYCLARAGKG